MAGFACAGDLVRGIVLNGNSTEPADMVRCAEAFRGTVSVALAVYYNAGWFIVTCGKHIDVAREDRRSASARSCDRTLLLSFTGLHCYSGRKRLRVSGTRTGSANAPGDSWHSKLQRLATDLGARIPAG